MNLFEWLALSCEIHIFCMFDKCFLNNFCPEDNSSEKATTWSANRTISILRKDIDLSIKKTKRKHRTNYKTSLRTSDALRCYLCDERESAVRDAMDEYNFIRKWRREEEEAAETTYR